MREQRKSESKARRGKEGRGGREGEGMEGVGWRKGEGKGREGRREAEGEGGKERGRGGGRETESENSIQLLTFVGPFLTEDKREPTHIL